MATPPGLLWKRDPHTAAKHHVLRSYYDAWFPIMLSQSWVKRLTVFEGYSGPGEYLPELGEELGSEGSPLIAMRSLLRRQDLIALGKPVAFVFVDEDEPRIENLRRLINERLTLPANVTFRAEAGRCEDIAIPLLGEEGAWGNPIFGNLDPYGADVPLHVVQALGANTSSEVFVTFMTERLVRFATDTTRLLEADAMFGNTTWREVSRYATDDKEPFLIEHYRETLAAAGLDKIAGFQLLDERGKGFWLLYATTHPRGVEKMKDAMWKVDPIHGYHFRDPRHHAQTSFDMSDAFQPNLLPLRAMILDFLEDGARRSVSDVRYFTLLETAYKEMHASTVLSKLIADGMVEKEKPGRVKVDDIVWRVAGDAPGLFD